MKRRWQNKIAESSATLPVACVVTTLLWWLPQATYSTDYLLGLAACALTTYVIIETNAVNALLRIRSRMVSSLFLLLMAVCGFLHPLQHATLVLFFLAGSFYFLLRTYEKLRPEADTFHSFLCLSLASLFWPSVWLLFIIQLWNLGVYLRALQWKSFGAAFMGLLLPYVFWGTAAFALGEPAPFLAQCAAIIQPFTETFAWQWLIQLGQTADWNGFWSGVHLGLSERLTLAAQTHLPELLALLLIILWGLTGFIHYLRKSYDDKIRVRMCHYTFMTILVCLWLWLLLRPSDLQYLLPLLLLTTAPSAAHFIALTHTRLTNLWVMLLTLGLIAIGVIALTPFPLFYS